MKSLLLIAFIVLLLFLPIKIRACTPIPDGYILILNSHGSSNKWSTGITQGIIETLTASNYPIALNIENLNLNHVNDFQLWTERTKVALKSYKHTPRLIVLIGDEAWMTYQYVVTDEWRNAPLILCGVKKYSVDLRQYLKTSGITFEELTPTEELAQQFNATGIIETYQVEKTIQLMQQLMPEMKQLAFISDNRYSGIYAQLIVKHVVNESFPGLKINYLDGRYLDGLSFRFILGQLNKDTGILLHGWMLDSKNNSYPERYFHKMKLQSPLFTLGDIGMSSGDYIGGYFPDNNDFGNKAANLVMNILNGQSPKDIPFIYNNDLQYQLSQKNLVDYNIPSKLWPEKAIYYQLVPSFYERNQNIINLTIFLLLLLSGIVITTLIFLYNNRKLKNNLAESLLYCRNLYESLLIQSKESNEQQAIQKILKLALQITQGDYAYVAMNEPGQQYARYFHLLRRISPNTFRDEIISKFPLSTTSLWLQELTDKQTICIDSVDELPDNHAKHEIMAFSQDIKSFIVSSLIANNTVIGHFSIGMYHHSYHWTQTEKEWLESLSHIISSILEQWERKKIKEESHEELRKSEKKFHSIFENLPVGAGIYDKNCRLREINDAMVEILGLESRDNIINYNILDNIALPAELRNKIQKGESVSQDIKYDFTFSNQIGHFHSRHNTVKDFHFISDTLRNARGETEGYMMLLIDNTDKYRSFQKIQELESLFSYASSNTNIGVATWNPVTNSGFATTEWYRNLGEQPYSQLPSNIFLCKHVHPTDRTRLLDFAQKIKNGKLDTLVMDVRVKKEEIWRWTKQYILLRHYEPDSKDVQIVGLNIDIDQQKRLEEELLIAKQKAEESDKLKTAFLANISHEIRTPLNAIVGFSELLNETESQKEKKEYSDIIERNTDLLLQLISDILDLSSIEAGTMEFTYERVDILKLMIDLQNTHQLDLSPETQLLIDPDLPPYRLYTDKNRLHQLLSNLITNAIKFTQSGTIRIGYQLQNEEIYFYVKDTGCGISEENQDKIFNRFVKLNKFVKGTGLGLSICKTIVEKLGGSIGVKSELGNGSTFWFRIPNAQ